VPPPESSFEVLFSLETETVFESSEVFFDSELSAPAPEHDINENKSGTNINDANILFKFL
jgi:hypothetical protein